MAEGGESGGKAADLYLGVVDLFAVLLPGLLMSGVGWKVLSVRYGKEFEGLSGPEFIPQWAIFLMVGYIVGHFLFALGALMMDPMYEGFYKRYFEFEKKKELPSMRRRADRIFHEVLGALDAEGDNRLTWGESFLTAVGPSAKATLDRLEADSKFFRSLAVTAIISVLIAFSPLTCWVTGWRWALVIGLWLIFIQLAFIRIKFRGRETVPKKSFNDRVKLRLLNYPEPAPPKLPSRFTWNDTEWLEAEAEENTESEKTIWNIPIAWGVLVIILAWMAHRPEAYAMGFVCGLLAFGSAWRYMEIRAKRLLQAYYFVIAIHKSSVFQPPLREKKT